MINPDAKLRTRLLQWLLRTMTVTEVQVGATDSPVYTQITIRGVDGYCPNPDKEPPADFLDNSPLGRRVQGYEADLTLACGSGEGNVTVNFVRSLNGGTKVLIEGRILTQLVPPQHLERSSLAVSQFAKHLLHLLQISRPPIGWPSVLIKDQVQSDSRVIEIRGATADDPIPGQPIEIALAESDLHAILVEAYKHHRATATYWREPNGVLFMRVEGRPSMENHLVCHRRQKAIRLGMLYGAGPKTLQQIADSLGAPTAPWFVGKQEFDRRYLAEPVVQPWVRDAAEIERIYRVPSHLLMPRSGWLASGYIPPAHPNCRCVINPQPYTEKEHSTMKIGDHYVVNAPATATALSSSHDVRGPFTRQEAINSAKAYVNGGEGQEATILKVTSKVRRKKAPIEIVTKG